MSLLTSLESRFARFAIPHLLVLLAALQLVTLVCFMVADARGAGGKFLELLILHPRSVWAGEVWRLVTFMFIPGYLTPLSGAFSIIVLSWVGRGLEQAWWPFRLNLYVFGGWAALVAGALTLNVPTTTLWLSSSFLLAFAMYFPDREIRLNFFIPIKVRWVAWMAVAYAFFAIVRDSRQFWPVVLGHLNFLIAFGPGLLKQTKTRAVAMERRQRFNAAMAPELPYFHKCNVCGKTESDDPKLEFRVTDDGDEICDVCRKAR
ncbi:MAG: hypothetical protein H7A55_07150 [Verrucomicrobiaceae bacterium]|nr:hypothetical protein [Verrucomicrobiaceae bacterium]